MVNLLKEWSRQEELNLQPPDHELYAHQNNKSAPPSLSISKLPLFIIFLCCLLAVSGCGLPSDPIYYSLPTIQKNQDTYAFSAMEQTPIVWNNELYLVLFHEEPGFKIQHLFTKEIVYDNPTYIYSAFGCAFVHTNVLYIFGVWEGSNKIYMTSTTDLNTWTPPIVVFPDFTGEVIYNCSISYGSDGFVMAYEVNLGAWTTRYAISSDLLTWQTVGSSFVGACPTIRYITGWYFITYMRTFNEYTATFAARTKDFSTFEFYNDYAILSPKDSSVNGTEGNNNSDADFVEWKSILYIVYNIGNQHNWGDLKIATYNGSLSGVFSELWP